MIDFHLNQDRVKRISWHENLNKPLSNNNINKWEKNGGIGIKHKDYKFMRTKERLLKLINIKYQHTQRLNLRYENTKLN